MSHKSKKFFNTLGRRNALVGVCLVTPSLIGLMLFYIVPTLQGVGMSFQKSMSDPTFVGFANYGDLLQSPAFRMAAGNTFRFMGLSVPLLMVMAFAMAMLIFHFKPKRLRTLSIMPLVIPVAAVTMVFEILSAYVHASSLTTLVVFYLWKNMGYITILLMAGLSSIPTALYEAAKIDGANAAQRMVRITLPMMMPTFFFSLVIAIIRSFQSFREAYLLFGDYPPEEVYLLQHFLNNNFRNLNYQRLSSAAMMVFGVILLFVLILYLGQKRTQRWEGS